MTIILPLLLLGVLLAGAFLSIAIGRLAILASVGLLFCVGALAFGIGAVAFFLLFQFFGAEYAALSLALSIALGLVVAVFLVKRIACEIGSASRGLRNCLERTNDHAH